MKFLSVFRRLRPGLLFLIFLSHCESAKAEFFEVKTVSHTSRLHIGLFEPGTNPVRGTVLFLHGHADRFQNHRPLLSRLAALGFRVVAFDLPGHGESSGALDGYAMSELEEMVTVLRARYADQKRPFVLAGWSWGALLAISWLQKHSNEGVSGAILLAPALKPFLLTGGDGIIRSQTLTQNPETENRSAPSFLTPLETPIFALRLLAYAWRVRLTDYPSRLRTLVFVSDPTQDLYVDENAVASYFSSKSLVEISPLYGSYHAVDFEPEPIRNLVFTRIEAFLKKLGT